MIYIYIFMYIIRYLILFGLNSVKSKSHTLPESQKTFLVEMDVHLPTSSSDNQEFYKLSMTVTTIHSSPTWNK